MSKSQVMAVAVVAAAAVYALAFYGVYLGAERSTGGLQWPPVVDGLVPAAVVCAAWVLAATRKVAVTALGVVVALVVVALVVPSDLVAVFGRTPMAWALIATLGVRLVLPRTEIGEPA
jgi:hypothetical protein